MDKHIASGALSRRELLRLSAVGGVAVAAAACTKTDDSGGGGGGGNNAAPPKPTADFTIPNPTQKLPSGDVTLRWIDSGDTKATFFKALFPEYQKKHPNIKIDYQGVSWNQVTQQVGLGFRNNSEADVFAMPLNISAAQAVSNGWLGAIDDLIPNWKQMLKTFPPGLFAEGVNQFNGKTYGVPFAGNIRLGNLILFNSDYTEKAGYDLNNKALSWDDFRKLAKQCTKDGKGKYYGMILGLTQEGGLSNIAASMTERSGLHGNSGGINWKTGEYNFTDPITADWIELLLAMKSDGSIFPGSASLDQPGARERFPQGVAAMISQGPWNIVPWKQADPSFPLGLTLPPVQDPKKTWPMTVGPGGADTWWHSAHTKLGPVIADLTTYILSENGQTNWTSYNGAAEPPVIAEVAKKAKLDPLNRKALDLANQNVYIAPAPAVRNPDVTKVFLAQKAPSPTFDQTLVGLYTGQVKGSLSKVLKAVEDRYNKSLDDAIKLAKSRGAKVSRSDWVFSDWDPSKPYSKLYKS